MVKKRRSSVDLANNDSTKLSKHSPDPKEQSTYESNRPSSNIIGISRTIAACQRCRQKKTKCDQQFPSCARCLKAGVDCVGLDPATGRQIPRSYVVYLEDKVSHLASLLQQNGIEITEQPHQTSNNDDTSHPAPIPLITHHEQQPSTASQSLNFIPDESSTANPATNSANSSSIIKNEQFENFTSIKMERSDSSSKSNAKSIKSSLNLAIATQNDSVSSYIGDSSGISFAKLLFTAVKFHPKSINENNSITAREPLSGYDEDQIVTTLPPKSTAESFVKAYFEQSNAQLPILHRETFVNSYFKPIYGNLSKNVRLASNYTKMNLDTSPIADEDTWYYQYKQRNLTKLTANDVPEEFHKPLFFLNMIFSISSSIYLLQYKPEISSSFKNQASEFIETVYASPDRLECLQGLLLLTEFSIMRPSTPSAWYVLGTTLRLCVDLGLHTEKLNDRFSAFDRDLRRRLFWCCYCLDRQLSTYLGRPFGIPEESVSTKFPVELDDCLITRDHDFLLNSNSLPTYKVISLSFFKIRKIQSEILRILYSSGSSIPYNLNDWKLKMDNKIENWLKNIPLKASRKANCDFNLEFFKLNYYHAKLLLFGVTPKNSKPNNNTLRIIFESSEGIITCYSDLFKTKSINYTWAAVHNLFMAGTSFFYAIYNSTEQLISLADFETYVKFAVEVFTSLIECCEGAGPCKEIFEILALAMVRLKFDNGIQKDQPIVSTDFDDIEKFFQQLNEATPSDFGTEFKSPVNEKTPSDYPSLSTPPMARAEEFNGVGSSNGNVNTNESNQNYRQNFNNNQYSNNAGRGEALDFEQQRVFDLLNQVSSDAIWDQLQLNGSFSGSGGGVWP